MILRAKTIWFLHIFMCYIILNTLTTSQQTESLIYYQMEELELKIVQSIKPSQPAPEVHDYLSPRTRVIYYVAEAESALGDPHKKRLP